MFQRQRKTSGKKTTGKLNKIESLMLINFTFKKKKN